MFAISFPLAHADRFSDWLAVWKKEQEQKAIDYQKSVLHFDYSKIQGKDAGFVTTDTKNSHGAKHIEKRVILYWKIIKNS